jgi:hypothetical protein
MGEKMHFRSNFAFRIDMWTDDGENIVEPMARAAAACNPDPATRSRGNSQRRREHHRAPGRHRGLRWSAGAVYTAGMTAVHDCVIYQAKWWTQGNGPVHNITASDSRRPSSIRRTSTSSNRPRALSGPLEAIARWSLLTMALGTWLGRSNGEPGYRSYYYPDLFTLIMRRRRLIALHDKTARLW